MICASRPVPSVVVTSACVSPRVKSAEPCVRGSTPVSTVILRTVCMSRPSMRGSPAMMRRRTMLYSRRPSSSVTWRGWYLAPSPVASDSTRAFLSLADARVARLLLGDLVGLDQFGFRLRGDSLGEIGVERRRLPVPGRLGGLGGEFADRVDGDLHLLVAVDHGAEHHGLGQQFGFGLDHQHRVGRAGHDEVEVRDLHVLGRWVQLVLAVDVAHARAHRSDP